MLWKRSEEHFSVAVYPAHTNRRGSGVGASLEAFASCPSGGKKPESNVSKNHRLFYSLFFPLKKVYRENTPFCILFICWSQSLEQCIGILLSLEDPERLRDRSALQERFLLVPPWTTLDR